MKIKMILTVFVLAASTWLAKAQTCSSGSCNVASCELVCNGSFEYNIGDPSAVSISSAQQVPLACGWDNYNNGGAPDRCSPATTTADYFTTGGANAVSIPCNNEGYEAARTGTAYVGFIAYGQMNVNDAPGCWYEAVVVPLRSALQDGRVYRLTFYLSLADGSDYNTDDNVGARIYSSVWTAATGQTQIVSTSAVTRNGWTQVSMTFTGSALNEDMLVVGAMKKATSRTAALTTTTGCAYMGSGLSGATYYYLEDVSMVEEITPTVTASSLSGCAGETFTLTASGLDTYTWTAVGSFGGSTNASVTVNPTTGTTYTVSGTSSAGCSVAQNTITISPYSCCQNPASGNITLRDVKLVPFGTSGALPWSSLTTGGFYTGTIAIPSNSVVTNTLTIVNTLSVAATMTFNTCNMVICEDDVIQQYSLTTIDHSLLKGDVSTMWEGIQSYGRIRVTNSWIQDAYYAIIAKAPIASTHPGLSVDNVLFNRNYVGIGTGVFNMNPADYSITGSIFSCRRFALAGAEDYTTTTRYTSLYPNIPTKVPEKLKGSTAHSITNSTIRSNYGVLLIGTTSNTTTPYFTIGAVTSSSNVPNSDLTNNFDYLNCGIYNLVSKASVINNIFGNMITTGTGTALGAIVHDDGNNNPSITQTEVGRSGNTNYKNVFGSAGLSSIILDGVVATGGGILNVSYNDFRTISRYGVSVKSWYAGTPANELVTVASNSYTDAAYAFYGYDNNSIDATVSTNTVVHSQNTYTAYTNVDLYEINKPATAIYHIYNNNFTNSLKGVNAVNTRGTRIVNNKITIHKPGTGVYNADISLYNCDYCVVAQNTLDCSPTNSSSWYTQGILTEGSANNTYKCNNISKVGNCLKFQNSCTSATIYKNTLNKTSGTDPCAVGLVVQSCQSIGDIGFPTGGGFGQSDDIWGDFSTADTYCTTSSNYNPVIGKIYYNGGAYAPDYQPQVNLNTFSIIPPDASQSYVPTTTTTANTDVCNEGARMMNVAGGGKNVTGNGAELNDGSVFASNGPEVFSYNKVSGRKRIIMNNAQSGNRNIGNNNEDRFFEVDSLFMVYASTHDMGALNSAKSINSAIIPNGQIQQNQKDFNSIHATYLEGDSLVTSSQIQDLQTLAYLCPETDGLAVYQARGLIRNWDDTTEYYNACERVLPELANNPEAVQRLLSNSVNNPTAAKPINVYPNPSVGKLSIENSPENGIFELYDIVGRKVYTSHITNATQIDLTSFNNGTYLYKIIQNDKVIKEDKLILNK